MPGYAPAITIGNDFSGLQAAQTAKDSQVIQQVQAAQRAQQEAQAQQQQAYEFQARQADETARQQSQDYFQSVQAAQSQAGQQADRADSANRFGAQLAQRATEDTQAEKDFQAQLAASKDATTQKNTFAQTQRDLADAQAAIKEGAYDDSPEKLGKDYGHLPGIAQAQLAQQLDARIKMKQSGFDADAAQLDIANQALKSNPNSLKMADRLKIAAMPGVRYNQSPATGTNFTMTAPRPMTPIEAAQNTAGTQAAINRGSPAIADQSAGLPQQSPVVNPAAAQPVAIQTQAQFDALPPGALFINPADGKTYRKKAADASP